MLPIAKNDEMAVVDEKLRPRGSKAVRIVDAGVSLEMRITNPMLTVLVIGRGLLRRLQRRVGGRWKGRDCQMNRCGKMVKSNHIIHMAFIVQSSFL